MKERNKEMYKRRNGIGKDKNISLPSILSHFMGQRPRNGAVH
jgi:hypothetical protein